MFTNANARTPLFMQGADQDSGACKNSDLRINMSQTTYQQEFNDCGLDEAKDASQEHRSNLAKSHQNGNEYQFFVDSPMHKNIFANGLYEIDKEIDSCDVRNH